MTGRLLELVAEAKASAATVEHPWDERAIDWPDLTPDSVVVEVGGYKGRWALQIAARYHPRLFVFEPQAWAYDVCKAVLGDQATVLNYALGADDGVLPMGNYETDGCSFVDTGGARMGYGSMDEIGTAFDDLGIDHVDLMLMNIEGYEYTLIPHMLAQGILPRRLMVQAHGDLGVLMHQLDAAGYRVLWTYGQVLTAWERV